MIDYSTAAQTYDNTRSHSDELSDRFNAAVALDSSKSVLDFGCGTGNYLARIQQRFGCPCYGVEPSEDMRAKALQKSGALTLVKGDHHHIPLPSDTFDFTFMTDVIHHVPDMASMFRELRRVLKHDGVLCVATESHAQIEGRFYNRYFPSLAAIEKQRYPDTGNIVIHADAAGLSHTFTDTRPAPARQITDSFVQNVAEKNWSMFRLLSDAEFSSGLRTLTADRGRAFAPTSAGDTLLWFRLTAQ